MLCWKVGIVLKETSYMIVYVVSHLQWLTILRLHLLEGIESLEGKENGKERNDSGLYCLIRQE